MEELCSVNYFKLSCIWLEWILPGFAIDFTFIINLAGNGACVQIVSFLFVILLEFVPFGYQDRKNHV